MINVLRNESEATKFYVITVVIQYGVYIRKAYCHCGKVKKINSPDSAIIY